MEPSVMKMKMALFLLAVLLTAATQALAKPDPNFHIYLCFGQSNMEGGGRIEEQERTVDPRFQVLADFDNPSRGWKKGQWYDAIPPLTRRTRGISLVDSFGRTMVANLPKNIRVGVVKVGVSGTKIELWDQGSYREYLATAEDWKVRFASEYGGNPYAYLVELAKIAQQSGVIKGILLHQGESNAEDKDWPNTTTRNESFWLFALPFQQFECSFAMRTISRKVSLLMIADNLDCQLQVEFGQSEYALHQHLALGKRQRRRLFFSFKRRRTRK
jgi:hypothetical protein